MFRQIIGACAFAVVAASCSSESGTNPPPDGAAGIGGEAGMGGMAGVGGDGGIGGGETDAGGVLSPTCQAYCASGHSLGCPEDDGYDFVCGAQCEAMRTAAPACESLSEAWMQCIGSAQQHFECSDVGFKIADGACPLEEKAVLQCWCLGDAAGPVADVTNACHDFCAKTASLPCANPGCDAECDQNHSGDYAWPLVSPYVACASKLPGSAFYCNPDFKVSAQEDALGACGGPYLGLVMCGVAGSYCACSPGAVCETACGDNYCADQPPSESCKQCLRDYCFTG